MGPFDRTSVIVGLHLEAATDFSDFSSGIFRPFVVALHVMSDFRFSKPQQRNRTTFMPENPNQYCPVGLYVSEKQNVLNGTILSAYISMK